jgi:multicomponent Na+:H+ antiporter subunit G
MAKVVQYSFVVAFSLTGLFFFIGGTVGLLRCPDLYARLHPSTKCDTLGACSIILALIILAGFSFVTLKLLAVAFLLLLSSATCGNAIGRSAFKRRVVPWHKPGVKPWPLEEDS